MNILSILISIACIVVLLPAGATLVLSSRIISREEELKARKLSVRECGKNG